jgi:hypothetical protein
MARFPKRVASFTYEGPRLTLQTELTTAGAALLVRARAAVDVLASCTLAEDLVQLADGRWEWYPKLTCGREFGDADDVALRQYASDVETLMRAALDAVGATDVVIHG